MKSLRIVLSAITILIGFVAAIVVFVQTSSMLVSMPCLAYMVLGMALFLSEMENINL